jgi:hypothetical protein
MVMVVDVKRIYPGVDIIEYQGLSSDPKPNDCSARSTFDELETMKVNQLGE